MVFVEWHENYENGEGIKRHGPMPPQSAISLVRITHIYVFATQKGLMVEV